MGYLIDVVMRKRFSSEVEAKTFIENLSKNSMYEITKHSIDKKERKQKGEIIDQWYLATMKLKFNDEKEPDYDVNINFGDDILGGEDNE